MKSPATLLALAITTVACAVAPPAANARGAITEFSLPQPLSTPCNLRSDGVDELWFLEIGIANRIGRFNVTTHKLTEIDIPGSTALPIKDPVGFACGISIAPSGDVWFTNYVSNKIGVVGPATNKVRQWSVPTVASGVEDLTVGPQGKIWFVETNANNIGSFDPATQKFAETAVPTPAASPIGIYAASDGQGQPNVFDVPNNPSTLHEMVALR
jgi:virginiamycin B lyase